MTMISKSMDKIVSILAKATVRYNIWPKEFYEAYKIRVLQELKKERPRATVVELSARTGIDRRFIQDYLKADSISCKPRKVDLVFKDAEAICKKNDQLLISKHDGAKSFENICKKHANGSLTPKAIFGELFRQGKLRDHGDYFQLMKPKHNKSFVDDGDAGVRRISKTISRSMNDFDWS